MTIIQTPIGIVETSIPTLYGVKHQFRSFDGLTKFDIPDWLGWTALVVGIIGGGALGGYIAWNARGAADALTNVDNWTKGIGNAVGNLFSSKKSRK
jgi:hypothetical protein